MVVIPTSKWVVMINRCLPQIFVADLVLTIIILPSSTATYNLLKTRWPLDDSNSVLKGNENQDFPWFPLRGFWSHMKDQPPNEGQTRSKLRLFPEDAPGEDRIIDQLMFTLPRGDNIMAPPRTKTILLADGFEEWNVESGRKTFLRDRCPVDLCSLTYDRRAAATADAIMYKDQHTRIAVQRPAHQIWILYYLEAPVHTPTLRASALGQFNWTSTYRSDSEIVAPYRKWMYYDPAVTSRESTRNYAANKTRKVAWFVSNCFTTNGRLNYAQKLSKYISVDIYGRCGDLSCPKSHTECFDMLDRDYKFYLAFENSNCHEYITEKLFDNGLLHNVIPIVMGARPEDYAAVAPSHSYIHVDDFTGPSELANYLHLLDRNDHLYNAYFKWKGTGEFIDHRYFCRVCAMLHARALRGHRSSYANVDAWWRRGQCTSI